MTVHYLEPYDLIHTKRARPRRPEGVVVDTLVEHFSAGWGDAESAARFLHDPKRKGGDPRYASAHFFNGRDGVIVQGCRLDYTAHHAGRSIFLGTGNDPYLNDRSIGCENCNRGWVKEQRDIDRLREAGRLFEGRHANPHSRAQYWEAFTDEQYIAKGGLLVKLKAVFPAMKYVTGHEDVVNRFLVDGAKVDPGPAYDWDRIHWESFGLVRIKFDYDAREHRAVLPDFEEIGADESVIRREHYDDEGNYLL